VEYNRASGDDPSTGKFTRYHPLFPTAHRWLGYMDLIGRQNIQSGVLHTSLKFSPKWSATFDLHSFWRVDEGDLVYSIVTGTPLAGQAVPPTSGAKHVGEEIDAVIVYRYNDFVALEGAGGLFLPANYLENAVGTAMSWFSYFQATFSL